MLFNRNNEHYSMVVANIILAYKIIRMIATVVVIVVVIGMQ